MTEKEKTEDQKGSQIMPEYFSAKSGSEERGKKGNKNQFFFLLFLLLILLVVSNTKSANNRLLQHIWYIGKQLIKNNILSALQMLNDIYLSVVHISKREKM